MPISSSCLLASRGLPNIKYSRSVESPPGFPGKGEVKKTTRLVLETADLKIAISALFIALSLSSSLRRRAILAMALSIDCLGRSARSIVLESALWYIASYYLVIMLRVGFLFSSRHRKRNAEETPARAVFDAIRRKWFGFLSVTISTWLVFGDISTCPV